MPITMVDKYRLPDLDYSGYTHVILTNPLKGLQDPTIEDLKPLLVLAELSGLKALKPSVAAR